MRFAMCLLGVLVLAACAAPVRLSEGMPNTLVVVNQTGAKEVVYDLRGDWVSPDGTITIKQEGPGVQAFWKEYDGCCTCRPGHRWFEGKIEGSRVDGWRFLCMSARRESLTMFIGESGDTFTISVLFVDSPGWLNFKRMK